jgi:DNA-binding transcriptional MerR regulator
VALDLTIDEVATATGTTTRTLRSFGSLGLIDPPTLRGRTGFYGPDHVERVHAVLRLQEAGFSLSSLVTLFAAQARGATLSDVLGLPEPRVPAATGTETDMAELYGFADLQVGRHRRTPQRVRPLLSVVPTTVWGQMEAS